MYAPPAVWQGLHFHHIKPHGGFFGLGAADIILGRLYNTPLFCCVDSLGRGAQAAGAAGFHLCKHQKLLLLQDQIQFTQPALILAKVTRDRYMCELDKQFPQYKLAQHKGYPTKLHYELIAQYGIQPFYRRSFLKKQGYWHE